MGIDISSAAGYSPLSPIRVYRLHYSINIIIFYIFSHCFYQRKSVHYNKNKCPDKWRQSVPKHCPKGRTDTKKNCPIFVPTHLSHIQHNLYRHSVHFVSKFSAKCTENTTPKVGTLASHSDLFTFTVLSGLMSSF